MALACTWIERCSRTALCWTIVCLSVSGTLQFAIDLCNSRPTIAVARIIVCVWRAPTCSARQSAVLSRWHPIIGD